MIGILFGKKHTYVSLISSKHAIISISLISCRFARINPKMLVPSMKLNDGTVVNDSRVIMKLMDKNCPTNQEEKVERIMDIAYSCDLGWYSTVPLKKKVWLWRLMQESGLVSYLCMCCAYFQVSHILYVSNSFLHIIRCVLHVLL